MGSACDIPTGFPSGSPELDQVDDATVAMRRARATQLDRVHDVVTSGRWHVHGYRSPHAWLAVTSGESPGACRTTLHLAERIQHMPIAHDRFRSGHLAESAVRLLADVWHPDIADVFARDEHLLVRWALNLAHRDFKLVLDTNSGPITLSAEAIRRLACDAGIHRLVTAPDGTIVDYGRQTRTVSDAQFDALTIRDHSCRMPGCPAPPGACDAHHSIHWSNHGNTDLDDLILVCWYHHHWLHEQHWSLRPLGAGHFQLTDPTGTVHQLRPPMIGAVLPQPTLFP